jgi:hypothetical protein
MELFEEMQNVVATVVVAFVNTIQNKIKSSRERLKHIQQEISQRVIVPGGVNQAILGLSLLVPFQEHGLQLTHPL